MDTTNSSEKPQRRVEDRKPAEVIDWAAPGAPAVPLYPAATSGDAPELQQLKALAQAATPGPWDYREADGISAIAHPEGWLLESGDEQECADKRYIAAASPAVVLDLIARIERATAYAQPVSTSSERVENAAGNEQVERAAAPAPAWAVLADSGNVIYWEHDEEKVKEVAARHGRPYGPYTSGAPRAIIPQENENAIEYVMSAVRHYRATGDAGTFDRIRTMLSPAASPATASGDELPELPAPLEIVWPELHRQGLGCGVEDRNITDRYDAAEYGWECGVERAIECVPELLYEEETVLEIQRAAYELGKARAAVSAATKPTADLNKLTVYEFSAFEDGNRQQYALLADVQSLLATKPAAAPAVPEGFVIVPINPTPAMNRAAVEYINGAGIYSSSLAPTVLEIEESIYHEVYRAMLAATPAASTIGAAQTADQVRDHALEEAARICWELQARPEFEPELQDRMLKVAEDRIRALKRPTTTQNSEAGE